MADISKGVINKAKEVSVLVPQADGGLVIDACHDKNDYSVCRSLKNMYFKNGVLKTRGGLCHPFEADIQGSFHSMSKRSFFGCVFYHCKNSIYCFDGKSKPYAIFDKASDCDSFFCEIHSVLYLYTGDEKIFAVNQSLEVSEVFPYTPTIIVNADPDLDSYEPFESFNLLSRRVTVRYKYSSYRRSYRLPYNADTEMGLRAVIDGDRELVGKSCSFTNDSTVSISTGYNGSFIDITFYISKASPECKSQMLFGCRFSECFGGTSVEGTRLFLSGNKDYPGYYFRSELLNPTYFKDLEFDIVGNGSDCITAFAKQHGDMYVFTERSISRMIYSFGENGASFTLKEISPRIGCDMSGSVALIDNRLVFANTYGGVYLIDSTDNTDERSVVPISGNILGSKESCTGFLAESIPDKQACVSIDYAGMYYLFIGSHAYVWNYTDTPFYTAYNKSNNAKNLAWFYFEGISARAVFELDGRLFLMLDGECIPSELTENYASDFGRSIESSLLTRSFDLALAHLIKRLDRLCFTMLNYPFSSVVVNVYADDEPYFSKRLVNSLFSWQGFSWNSFSFSLKSKQSHYLRLPGKKAYSFSLELLCDKGGIGISDIELIFKKNI